MLCQSNICSFLVPSQLARLYASVSQAMKTFSSEVPVFLHWVYKSTGGQDKYKKVSYKKILHLKDPSQPPPFSMTSKLLI